MKTKRILAMLMAMCMLCACSMVVSAGEEASEAAVVTNYLSSVKEECGDYRPAKEAILSNMVLTGTEEGASSVILPDGSEASVRTAENGIVSATGKTIRTLNTGFAKGTQVRAWYRTNTNLPAQKYILSVWYKTNLEKMASIMVSYVGSANNATDNIGYKRFAAALPSTNGAWKQFFMICDATEDTYYDETDNTTYLTDDAGEVVLVDDNKVAFTGYDIYLGHEKTAAPLVDASGTTVEDAAAYIEFCNPVLAPMTEDVSGVFTNTVPYLFLKTDGKTENSEKGIYNADTTGGDETDLYNFLGVKETSVTAGSEVTFKVAPASLSAKDAKVQEGQVILATYAETDDGKSLTNIEILPFTDGIGGATCTVPEAFANKTIKAYFWGSDGSLKPLAAPATVTVEAAPEEPAE